MSDAQKPPAPRLVASNDVDGATVVKKHRGLMPPWQPGQSGNPQGKPKGARTALTEDFIKALHDDFRAGGPEAIVAGREGEPAKYVQILAGLVPRDVSLDVSASALSGVSDEALTGLLKLLELCDRVGRGDLELANAAELLAALIEPSGAA